MLVWPLTGIGNTSLGLRLIYGSGLIGEVDPCG
jgi:hypothetical protein